MKSVFTRYSRRSAFAAALAIVLLLSVWAANSNSVSSAATPIKNNEPASSLLLAADIDLTGVWKGDDNATYYIRHIPRKPNAFSVFLGAKDAVKDDVYWFGQGNGFGNVFHGMISKGQVNQISGEWADVPIGGATNSGFLTLTVASKDRLILMGEPGNFAAREWKRVTLKLPTKLPPLKPNN